jgi:hypothetical protein
MTIYLTIACYGSYHQADLEGLIKIFIFAAFLGWCDDMDFNVKKTTFIEIKP